MKQDISKLLQKKKKNILEDWISLQLADAGLREDLMSNDELREQSAELLDALLQG
ncbi:MAG: RsbRD N-terminal domain-containing protein, partial [Niastella sp.]|uniref:RsbRD N-terminal domain-containing protein n=1 Tax=Niastella sp. TaxID=1869183 RepID=UPI00389B2425